MKLFRVHYRTGVRGKIITIIHQFCQPEIFRVIFVFQLQLNRISTNQNGIFTFTFMVHILLLFHSGIDMLTKNLYSFRRNRYCGNAEIENTKQEFANRRTMRCCKFYKRGRSRNNADRHHSYDGTIPLESDSARMDIVVVRLRLLHESSKIFQYTRA